MALEELQSNDSSALTPTDMLALSHPASLKAASVGA